MENKYQSTYILAQEKLNKIVEQKENMEHYMLGDFFTFKKNDNQGVEENDIDSIRNSGFTYINPNKELIPVSFKNKWGEILTGFIYSFNMYSEMRSIKMGYKMYCYANVIVLDEKTGKPDSITYLLRCSSLKIDKKFKPVIPAIIKEINKNHYKNRLPQNEN